MERYTSFILGLDQVVLGDCHRGMGIGAHQPVDDIGIRACRQRCTKLLKTASLRITVGLVDLRGARFKIGCASAHRFTCRLQPVLDQRPSLPFVLVVDAYVASRLCESHIEVMAVSKVARTVGNASSRRSLSIRSIAVSPSRRAWYARLATRGAWAMFTMRSRFTVSGSCLPRCSPSNSRPSSMRAASAPSSSGLITPQTLCALAQSCRESSPELRGWPARPPRVTPPRTAGQLELATRRLPQAGETCDVQGVTSAFAF